MVNSDPNTVEPLKSFDRYRALFDDFENIVAAEMARQTRFAPDIVLSNIGFVPLEAARRLGIPAVALAPFHWGQIFEAYCGDMVGGASILERLNAIYSNCDMFIATAPHVPMPSCIPLRAVGPISSVSEQRRAALKAALGLPRERRLALIAMGGIGGALPIEDWPEFHGWTFIHRGPDTCGEHKNVVPGESLPFTFAELVASVDAVLTKPGYGTVTECACAGTPILYRSRDDWPETPHMMEWAARHVAVAELDNATFKSGQFQEKLQMLLQAPRLERARPTGIADVVALIWPYLS